MYTCPHFLFLPANNLRMRQILVAILIAIVFLIPSLVLKMAVEPVHRRFSCNDSELSYPYEKERIPYFLLIALCFSFCALVIFIVEYCDVSPSTNYIGVYNASTDTYYPPRRNRFPTLTRSFEYLAPLLVALSAIEMVKNCFAFSLGFLRPHFLSLCRPRCVEAEESSCFSRTPAQLKEARLSFPSGHAAVSIACATYINCYLHMKLRHLPHMSMPLAFMSFIFLGVALFVGFQTTSSYMHHVQDVVGGIGLGVLCASIMVHYGLCQNAVGGRGTNDGKEVQVHEEGDIIEWSLLRVRDAIVRIFLFALSLVSCAFISTL